MRRFFVFPLLAVTSLAQPAADPGRKLFDSLCASCHNADGRGGERGPEIVSTARLRARNETALREVIRKVVVPNALPGMIDAVRVNAAAAWNFVVVAELVAADSGLGYRIIRAQRFTNIDQIFAILFVIGVLGLTFDLAMRMLRDRVGLWVA